MHFTSSLLAAAAAVGSANAAFQGFNYGAFFLDQSAKQQADFAYEFNRAKSLPNTSGWTSARLYTMIQWNTASDVITAIPAAIETQTQLLLGLWTSGGAASFANEITALEKAISYYGSAFTDLVVGISVGSEDLYRDSTGGSEGVGVDPTTLVDYIQRVRAVIAGTNLANVPVGHVDTWTVYENATNSALIAACDFIGVDAYPYFETDLENSIENAEALFYDAWTRTLAATQGKSVWVTETGWPVSGETRHLAVANSDNARLYYHAVACSLIKSNINVFWYILQESQYGTANPDFGVYPAGDLQQVSANFDLSC